MAKPEKRQQFNVWVEPRLAAWLHEATRKTEENPYPKTKQQIFERGLKLAQREINGKKKD